MAEFSPLTALTGGMLIGLAAVLLLLTNGRVMGIAGILDGALRVRSRERGWRLAFVGGLMLPGVVWGLAGRLDIAAQASLPMLALAGLLVGFGTRMGNGCTSGHGICGLARLSRRSMAAVAVFMATCAATVFVLRHALGG